MDQLNQLICAELPDPITEPLLFELVKTHMVHRCGVLNKNAPCLDANGICSKQFPKAFAQETILNHDGYPIYRRRDNFKYEENGLVIDNRY